MFYASVKDILVFTLLDTTYRAHLKKNYYSYALYKCISHLITYLHTNFQWKIAIFTYFFNPLHTFSRTMTERKFTPRCHVSVLFIRSLGTCPTEQCFQKIECDC